jgi:hypothetical protein
MFEPSECEEGAIVVKEGCRGRKNVRSNCCSLMLLLASDSLTKEGNTERSITESEQLEKSASVTAAYERFGGTLRSKAIGQHIILVSKSDC